tara:strand:+ start:580 stop:750 length:171 start_codon:yes stop_codon:yes gene_type:complete
VQQGFNIPLVLTRYLLGGNENSLLPRKDVNPINIKIKNFIEQFKILKENSGLSKNK